MPSPTEIKPTVEPEFDLLAFWITHKTKVVLLAALLIFGLIAFGLFQLVQYRANQAAARDFASAKSADDYRRVLSAHAKSAAAGNAALLLAAELRAENKLPESSAVLEQMVAEEPEHPMISGAWLSLAVNLELQEKTDEALAAYQKVSTFYPASFSAPAAFLGQARILKAKGKNEEAKRAYDTVINDFGDSFYARLATQEKQALKK